MNIGMIIFIVSMGLIALAELFCFFYELGVIDGGIKQMKEDQEELDEAFRQVHKELDRILGKK